MLQRFLPYAVALGAVSLAAVLRGTLLAPMMGGGRAPFGLFTMAIIFTAWMGGFTPGLFATVLGAAIGCLFFVSPYGFSQATLGILVIFVVNGVLISLVCELLRRNRNRVVTAREQVQRGQANLKESEERFQRMADSASILVSVTNSEGKATWFNKPWLSFTGRSMEEEQGEGWLENIHPDDRQRTLSLREKAAASHEPYEFDFRLRQNTGEYRWVLEQATPLFAAGDEFQGYVRACLDIHERKEAEQRIEALLKSEQAARAEAEHTAKLKDEFLATVSHEMRTPLTAMLGWVQLLRKGNLSGAAVPQALETIERNARAQTKLIDDLLDMSRILSDHLKLETQPLDASSLVEGAVAEAAPAAAAKGVTLKADINTTPITFVGDSLRLQQIFRNLLNNAIKFTPAQGTVTVSVSQFDDKVRFDVTDTGEGIDKEFLPHVFESFRQQDSSTSRRHQGLGLGLSIARQLAELHGGSLEATSEGAGFGSVFSLTLPIGSFEAPPRVERPAIRPESSEADANLPTLLGAKILVVDDDDDARELLRSILAQHGASVRTAACASEAIQQIDSRPPDVLVSDIGMPDEDGYQLIRRIRSRPPEEGGKVPALALTAFARTDDRRRAIGAGFQMHLAKPVEPSELVTVVASLLKV